MNEEKYKKERIEYIADKISPYTVAGCDEDLAEAIFNLVEEENARLKDKLTEINKVIDGYMPNEHAMCKAFDEIEFIIKEN